MSRLRMGFYEKIIIEFKEAFWPADAPFIGCCPPTVLAEPKERPDAEECSESTSSSSSPSKSATRSGHSGHAARGVTAPSGSAMGVEDGTTRPILPVFLENYLWSKGVPVLATAVSGRTARHVSTEHSRGKKGGFSAPTEAEAPAPSAVQSRINGMTVSRLRQKTAALGGIHTGTYCACCENRKHSLSVSLSIYIYMYMYSASVHTYVSCWILSRCARLISFNWLSRWTPTSLNHASSAVSLCLTNAACPPSGRHGSSSLTDAISVAMLSFLLFLFCDVAKTSQLALPAKSARLFRRRIFQNRIFSPPVRKNGNT